MTGLDIWAPLGVAGTIDVVDEFGWRQAPPPPETPYVHRCDVDVAGNRIELSWRTGLILSASLIDAAGNVELLSGDSAWTLGGQDNFLWNHMVMPIEVLGDRVDVVRERSGRERWQFAVTGPGGRSWRWRPAGWVFADRMELTRDGESEPLVTHTLRPVPGRPRSPAGPPTVSWRASAGLAEVLMPVMWVLDQVHHGLLPKTQRIARGDVIF